MKSSEYNVIIGILSAIILILPFTGKVYDKRYNIIKRIQFRGWILIFFFLSTVFVTYLKDVKIADDEDNKDLAIKMAKANSDLIIRANNFEIIDALGKYNLSLDQKTQSIIKMVRDSAKRIINVNTSILPSLSLSKMTLMSLNDPDYSFELEMLCTNNNAFNINLLLFAITEGKSGFIYNLNGQFYSKGGSLNSGSTITNLAKINVYDNTRTKFHFLVIGSYSNLEGKIIPFKQMLYYDFELKRGMMVLPEPAYSKMFEIFRKFGAKG